MSITNGKEKAKCFSDSESKLSRKQYSLNIPKPLTISPNPIYYLTYTVNFTLEIKMAKRKKIGEMLVEKKIISQLQLDRTILEQNQWGGRLGKNLVKLGFVGEITLLKFLSKQLSLPCVDISKINLSKKVYALLPASLAKEHSVFPLDLRQDGANKKIYMAMSDPTNFNAIDDIRFQTGHPVNPVIATETQIETAISKYYDNNLEKRIAPLKAKLPITISKELEIITEPTLKQGSSTKKNAILKKNQELQAVTQLLIKKGIITKEELMAEIRKLEGN